MKASEIALGRRFEKALEEFSRDQFPLPGIEEPRRRAVLVEQLIDSDRRIRFIATLLERDISPLRADPKSQLFDPVRASILKMREGKVDEAFWLVFLFVHFGKNLRSGYRLVRDIYGALGERQHWTWERISRNIDSFHEWLIKHYEILKGADDVSRGFGNHRKYESLRDEYTGATIESYVNWIGASRSHEKFLASILEQNEGDPYASFDDLYESMEDVYRFGRTARFDYLTMIAKIGLVPIAPGVPYLIGATGPLAGAKLLFTTARMAPTSTRQLEARVVLLGNALGVGMQVMEDSLCNWQKDPDNYTRFNG